MKQLILRMVAIIRRIVFYTNLLAANGLSKPIADGKSTGDRRIRGATGCSHLDGTK